MKRVSKIIWLALLAMWCLTLFTLVRQTYGGNDSPAAISPEQLQKIEQAVPTKPIVTPKQPRKLLVFNLCKGFKHDSIPYIAKALEIMGRKTGAYDTVISSDMSMFKPQNLNQFDAVCFNNTTRLEFNDPELRKTLMNFVKGGKGIVGIHAATDNFYNWPEAAKMIGGQFCGHPWGAGGTWAIKIDDPDHPVVAMFEGRGFKIQDEIYRTKPPFYSRANQRVLMSLDTTDPATRNVSDFKPYDKDTGISWVKSYGKGRIFYCSLGHNHHITWNPLILQHYLAGIQFALGDLPADTTPSSLEPLDELLAKIATYDYGHSREPLSKLTDLIRDSYNSPAALKQIEKRLVEFLRSDATLASKQFICRKLSIIGTEEAVPVLADMLTRPSTSDMARYALERIPGEAVNDALRKALDQTSGKTKVGIINSLGMRGDEKSVVTLGSLIYDSDPTVAAGCVAALGKIATSEAIAALEQAREKTTGELRLLVLDAYLNCADQLVAQGRVTEALNIYKQLYSPDEPIPIRAAALRGLVSAKPDKAIGIVCETIAGDDEAMKVVAIDLVREIAPTERIKAVSAQLPNLSVTHQVQLLSALADRGDSSALPAVINATKSTEAAVRIAALSALARLGDASTVDLLAQTAATTRGQARLTARESLYRLSGPGVDETILANIQSAATDVKVELIRSIAERNILTAVETLLQTAQNPNAQVRQESLKVLKIVANPKHLPALIEILINAPSKTDRMEAEKTIAAVAHKIPDKNRRAEAVLSVLPSIKDITTRCSLLSVLGKIGDDSSLPVLRAAISSPETKIRDAAIRSLSDWPNDKPAADLLKVVQATANKTHRALALRGFIRLIGLESDRPQERTIQMYRQAMDLASSASEKRMVLSGLANVKSFAALAMAADCLDDRALQSEAEVAVVKIAESTLDSHPQQTRAVLQKVIQISKNNSLRQQAQKLIDKISR